MGEHLRALIGELRDWQKLRRDWVTANDACRRDILDRLRDAGPLTSRQLPDTCAVPWASTWRGQLPWDREDAGLDATADRRAGVIRIAAIHRDVTFTGPMTAAVHREIEDLARWLERR